MYKKKTILLILLALLFFVPLRSQTKDSRQQQVAALLQSAQKLRVASENEKSLAALKQAEALATESGQYTQLAETYAQLTRHYISIHNLPNIKQSATEAVRAANLARQPAAMAYACYAQANYYNFFDIRNLAIENTQAAFGYLEKSRNDTLSRTLAPYLYYILYGTHSYSDNADLAEKYARLTMSSAQEASDMNILSNAYSAMSTVMGYRFKATDSAHYRDSVLYYLNKSIEVYNQNPQLVSSRTCAISNINIANYYFQYKNAHSKAIADSVRKYAREAIRIISDKDHNYLVRGNANGMLSEVEIMQGNYTEAEKQLSETFIAAEAIQSADQYMLSNLSQSLCDLYEKTGEYRKALDFKKKKEVLEQKMYNRSQMEQALKLEAQYENSQIKQEMEIIQERVKNKKLQNGLYLGITVLALTALFFISRNLKNKTKLHQEKELRLHEEKENVERNANVRLLLEKQEQARLKAEHELLVIKTEQMKKEALAGALQIERKNKLLTEIKKDLKPESTRIVEKKLREEKRLEQSLDKSVTDFQHIHPRFFSRLAELSEHRLTALDLKYCACLYLKMSTKEIAAAYHVAPKSVRMSKYRIKQKLNLTPEIVLEDFLIGLVGD